MTNSNTKRVTSLDTLFHQLREWRHFPNYQFERRVDGLIGLVIARVLQNSEVLQNKYPHIGDADLTVIPEFPLQYEKVFDKTKNDDGRSIRNLSAKVDFAVIASHSRMKQIFLVELKTDNNSINFEQLDNMNQAKTARAENMLKGVIKLARATKKQHHKFKYAHLIWKLNDIGCIGPGPCSELTGFMLNCTEGTSNNWVILGNSISWSRIFQIRR